MYVYQSKSCKRVSQEYPSYKLLDLMLCLVQYITYGFHKNLRESRAVVRVVGNVN